VAAVAAAAAAMVGATEGKAAGALPARLQVLSHSHLDLLLSAAVVAAATAAMAAAMVAGTEGDWGRSTFSLTAVHHTPAAAALVALAAVAAVAAAMGGAPGRVCCAVAVFVS